MLDEEFADMTLNLQSILNICYEEGVYSRIINYEKPLIPSLKAEDKQWANSLLIEKGLRTKK